MLISIQTKNTVKAVFRILEVGCMNSEWMTCKNVLEGTSPERGFSAIHSGTPCPWFCHDGASFVRQQSIRTRQILLEFYLLVQKCIASLFHVIENLVVCMKHGQKNVAEIGAATIFWSHDFTYDLQRRGSRSWFVIRTTAGGSLVDAKIPGMELYGVGAYISKMANAALSFPGIFPCTDSLPRPWMVENTSRFNPRATVLSWEQLILLMYSQDGGSSSRHIYSIMIRSWSCFAPSKLSIDQRFEVSVWKKWTVLSILKWNDSGSNRAMCCSVIIVSVSEGESLSRGWLLNTNWYRNTTGGVGISNLLKYKSTFFCLWFNYLLN
jgi:hypothetical protein